jgi:hypothetical protein
MTKLFSYKGLIEHDRPVVLLGWLLIAVHYCLFSQFFPNAQGKLGHDYAYNLPMLLDGFYWFQNNGLRALPWFTPSFCGGMPQLANPATFYLSTAQFFTFLVGPLVGVKLTLLLFAALGYWGFYHLLTAIYRVRPWPALLGGALFLFNGFYAYRFIVGHLEFHAFMLVPLTAFLLLAEPPPGPLRRWRKGRNVLAAGLLIAYMFLAGMTQLMIPALMTMVLFALVKKVLDEDFSLRPFFLGFVLAGLISLGLSAAKLTASLSFLAHFPRDSYTLPGVEGIGRLLGLTVRVLALGGAGVDGASVLSNSRWTMERHEFEYGVGMVPFLLLGIGLLPVARRWRNLRASLPVRPGARLSLAGIVLLLAVPLLLNYYSPGWNAFLKTVPIVRNLSNFLRWFAIYIPMLILAAVLVLERAERFRGQVVRIVWAGVAVLLLQTLSVDREFYHAQPYDPARIEAAYEAARRQGVPPQISSLVVSTDADGRPALTGDRNDALANGQSQLLCYEPMFGFRLEFLPFKNIHAGPVLDSDGRVFNLKNPACYLYPAENGCEPGGHFRIDQLGEMEQFTSFHPFAHTRSSAQKGADLLTLLTLLAVAAVACLYLGVELRNFRTRRQRPAGGN